MKKLDMMRAIKERGFMAKDVADKLGITTVAMSLRTNAKNPRLDTMVQIAEVIGCDITDLFYPDPAEEAAAQEENSHLAISELKEIMRKAYPSIATERVEEIMKMIEEKGCGHKTAEELEEARKKHEGQTLNATLWGDLPEGIISRDVKFVQQAAENEPSYPVHENRLVSENQQQMIQTSTFCPHCGKKVRVGVVLLPEEG